MLKKLTAKTMSNTLAKVDIEVEPLKGWTGQPPVPQELKK